MEAELDREKRRETTPAPEEALAQEPAKEPEALRVVGGASRCPFCHSHVAVETQEWVACQGCLARHHATCWGENGSCASCHGTKAIAPPKPTRINPAFAFSVVAMFFGLLALVLVAADRSDLRARLSALESRSAQASAPAPASDASAAREETIRVALDELVKREKTTGENPRTSVVAPSLTALARELEARGRPLDGRRVQGAAKLASLDIEAATVLAALGHPALTDSEITLVVAKSYEDFAAVGLGSYTDAPLPEGDRHQYLDKLVEAAKRYEHAGRVDDAGRVRAAAQALERGEAAAPVLAILGGKTGGK